MENPRILSIGKAPHFLLKKKEVGNHLSRKSIPVVV
jgi:hypothetical protein